MLLEAAGIPAPTWNVTPARFHDQLAGLLARGFIAWPLRRALDVHRRGREIPPRVFVVTFDDGYENNFTQAYPVPIASSLTGTIPPATSGEFAGPETPTAAFTEGSSQRRSKLVDSTGSFAARREWRRVPAAVSAVLGFAGFPCDGGSPGVGRDLLARSARIDRRVPARPECSGDTGVLQESAPFLRDRLLTAEEESYYGQSHISGETGTLYEHCKRAIQN